MIILFFVLIFESRIDSLKQVLIQNQQIEPLLELNKCYLAMKEFDSGISLLKEYEKYFSASDVPLIKYKLADDLLFGGKIIDAREEYLKLIGRFAHSEIANDALERLYLIEAARGDTVILKRFMDAVRLYETEQYVSAADSLRNLLKSQIGHYALYYLSFVYYAQEQLSLSLEALNELNNLFPEHNIHNATLLLAEINFRLERREATREILEELMTRVPNSIYAVRARHMLRDMEKQ